ncbi:MAG TPA: zinc ABC transporter substrate-binding protein, partial [Fimbriimonadaceae bacterium]|nr:zinc ABC transporter substrate-binding protein [Fimbriimonadaceae bacterium]
MKVWPLFPWLLLFVLGCGPSGSASKNSGKLQIVCTTGMVADVVKAVGGEFVEVQALMGPGTDPHLYKASPGDVAKINRADLVFYSGLHLEGKMADI